MKITEFCREAAAKDRFGTVDAELLEQRLRKLLSDVLEKGVRVHDGRAVVTGYYYNELYDWDLYFECLFLSYFGYSQYCRNGVEMFLDKQEPSGFVARTMGICFDKPRHHFKPFLAQIALLGSRQEKDFRWLGGKYYEKLCKYLDYWFRHCDADKNGLCFWDGSDHSGMDNQKPRLGFVGQMEYEGVDLNCYLVRELDAMSEIAKELGKPEDAEKFRLHSEKLVSLIDEYFWDETDGFYYDRSEITGEKNRIKSVAGLLPLWLGKIPQERADRLIREHLLNPEEFWLQYPVATWAKSEKGYYQERKGGECNWMGTTWIPTNYMVFHGLVKHGAHEAARELAEKTYELVISEGEIREYYNGETGSGQGLNPFWGWGSLGLMMPYEFHHGYDPSELGRTGYFVAGNK